MKRGGLLVCALVIGSAAVVRTQAPRAPVAERPLRVVVIESGDPVADPAGRRDSTRELRTRLEQRLDRRTAQLVPDNADADITVIVTSRELVGKNETNTVYAELRFRGVVRAQLTGLDEGMWRPAATDLAKNIATWVTKNERPIRDCLGDPKGAKCSYTVDGGTDKGSVIATGPDVQPDRIPRAPQLIDEAGQLLRSNQLIGAKARLQEAEKTAPNQKAIQDGLAEIKRREDSYQRWKAAAESDAANQNIAAAADKLKQAQAAHPELFAADNLPSLLSKFSQQLESEKAVAEARRLSDQALRLAEAGKYSDADAANAAALRLNPNDQNAAAALKKSEHFVALTKEGAQLEKRRNFQVAQQRLIEARTIDATRFEREGLTAVLQRLLQSSGPQPPDAILKQGLLALFKDGDAAKSIAILELRLAGHGGVANDAGLHAYLGVAYATRALSAVEADDQGRWRQKALEEFRRTRAEQPDYQLSSRLVSPKILALFDDAGR